MDNNRICSKCGNTKTYIKRNGKPQWCHINDELVCTKCWWKLYYGRIRTQRRFVYKDSRLMSDEKQRTGYCSWCPNNTHDGSCKLTQMAHLIYDDKNPEDHRVELCVSCHKRFDAAISRILAVGRECGICGSSKTGIRIRGKYGIKYKKWYRIDDESWMCSTCEDRFRMRVRRNSTRSYKEY